MKWVEANDSILVCLLASQYYRRFIGGLPQDQAKAMELWKQAAELDSSDAHYNLGVYFDDKRDLKKAKFHYGATAIAGHEGATLNLGTMEAQS